MRPSCMDQAPLGDYHPNVEQKGRRTKGTGHADNNEENSVERNRRHFRKVNLIPDLELNGVVRDRGGGIPIRFPLHDGQRRVDKQR